MEMTQPPPTRITPKQNEYLLELATGPKTTQDLMRSFMVSMATASKMLKIIRDAGLIESPHAEGIQGNVRVHSLITPYDEMVKNGLIVTNYNRSIPILDEEILYAAILRNAGLTGQRLQEQHRKVYPNRAANGIKGIVLTARKRRLCR